MALALVVGGCGGKGEEAAKPKPRSETKTVTYPGVEPREWAHDVCTAVAAWQEDFGKSTAKLIQRNRGERSLHAVRSNVIEWASLGVRRSDRLLAVVEEAGQPAVEDGRRASGQIREAVRLMRTTYVDARAKARELPVENPRRFVKEVRELGDLFDRYARVGRAFEKAEADVPELGRAPACVRLKQR